MEEVLAPVENVLDKVVYGNTILSYIVALVLFIACFVLISVAVKVIRKLVLRITSRFANETVTKIIQSESYLHPFFHFIPFYVIIYYLNLPPLAERVIDKLGVVILGVCVVRFLVSVMKALSHGYVSNRDGNPLVSHTINMVGMILLYALGALFVLSNLGFNINTLIAGLGIGGMAIALASQTLLADLFNYFTILIDQPFSIGDSISVGGVSGTVEKIGLKGTRIRSIGGELLILSNTDMTKNILSNFQQMQKRRMCMTLGVTYSTPKATVAEIPELLHNIVGSTDGVEFTRAHLIEFAGSSLNFELVYFVLSADYGVYLDRVQEVNLKIFDEFEKRGIGFAYPTQSIYIEKA